MFPFFDAARRGRWCRQVHRQKICPEVAPPFPYKLRGTKRGEIMVNLMTEDDGPKRLNLSVALLRRRPRGSRGVVLHDRFDPRSSNRNGQRAIGRRAERSSNSMPWTAFLGILNQQVASTTETGRLSSNISGYLRYICVGPVCRQAAGESVDGNMPKPKKGAKGALQSNRKAADAEFWSKRSSAFGEGHQKYPDLRGHWNSITDVYNLLGSEEARSHFVVLAEIGAAARPSPPDIELWKLWLAELICLKINCEERPLTQSYPVEYLSDPRHKLRTPHDALPAGEGFQQPGSTDRVFEGKTITVHRLFEASALLCDRLGSEATADASRAGHATDGSAGRNTVGLRQTSAQSEQELQKPLRGRKAKKPERRNDRYKNIDAVLQEISESRPNTQEEIFTSLDG